MRVSAGKILKYSMLPGILPRVSSFFSSGFVYVSLFMAAALQAARLLPPGHAYFNPANKGQFGIRHVMAEARRNLVFKRENADQIIMYYTLCLGFFLLLAQFLLLAGSLTVNFAKAASPSPSYYAGFLTTQHADSDVAFHMLDRVFGMPGIFGSCVDPGITCTNDHFKSVDASSLPWPTAFHGAFHEIFHFYNVGLMAVALLVFLYMVTTVVAETAQSGTPFGRRFNHAWVPVRLVLAIGLLIPLTEGLNGAQLITLHVAKWGSNLATNTWIAFNEGIATSTPAGPQESLVMVPTPPEFNTFLEFMMVVHTCKSMIFSEYGEDVQAYQIYQGNRRRLEWVDNDYDAALAFSENNDIVVRFGVHNDSYSQYEASVRPYCGEVTLQVKDISTPGAKDVQASYYKDFVTYVFYDFQYIGDGVNIGQSYSPKRISKGDISYFDREYLKDKYITYYNNKIAEAVVNARQKQVQSTLWFEDNLIELGWGGAGTWYNKIAELNGSFVASVQNLPTPTLYPEVMELVAKTKLATDDLLTSKQRFNPTPTGDKAIPFERSGDLYIAEGLYKAQNIWADSFVKQKGNIFSDTITALFGLQGLYDLYANVGVHPLAQLTGVGRSLMESAVTNLGFAFGSGVLGGLANILGLAQIGSVGQAVKGIFWNIAVLGISIGFILSYIVPFLPFLYFFFAMCTWVKVIFEAMVGVPLWAIAHIRIDGEGIPGPAGLNGYWMLLEIFIRPVIIIVALVSSVLLFGAQVHVLNGIWSLVTTNLTGFDSQSAAAAGNIMEYARDVVDSFFFMIIYTIIVYMIGLSSFKLIDQIPNSILRWMGSSVSGFREYSEDPTNDFLQKTFVASQSIMGRLSGILNR